MANKNDHNGPFNMSPVTSLPQKLPEVRRVEVAANGLVIVGTAGLLLNCLLNFGSMMLAPEEPAPAIRALEDAGRALDPAAAERGRDAAPLMQTCAIAVPTLLVYPLAIVGGLRMKQLRNHRLAVASSIVVMLPCSCAFLAGLPIGLWSLTVLTTPEVKSRFH